jgi:ABC-2 type transport system permease protein
LHTLWTATLLRQRVGVLVWGVATALTLAMMAYLEPAVIDVWGKFDLTQSMIGDRAGVSPEQQYLSFAAQLVLPILTAYVITQASGWVNDLRHGRVELFLAAPVSWPGLVLYRLLALVCVAAVITAGGMCGLVAGFLVVGVQPDPLGLARVCADVLLFTAAATAVAQGSDKAA